ncbi:MFS transporter [Nocardia fusca]|uniref:MFS transporter n=1 Tax=Nocardia fusca TaxID=941183 RepID=UPI000AA4784A|nr:MFS transporter [Nocardia fusca]
MGYLGLEWQRNPSSNSLRGVGAGGALLLVLPWRGVFLILAVIGLLLAAGVWRWIPESLPRPARRPGGVAAGLRSIGAPAARGAVLAPVVALSFGGAAVFAYIAGTTFVFQEIYHLTAAAASVVYGVNAVGNMMGSLAYGRLVRRWSPEMLLCAGAAVALAGQVLLVSIAVTVGSSMMSTWLCLLVSLTAFGVFFPAVVTIAQQRGRSAPGATSALLGGGQFLFGAAGVTRERRVDSNRGILAGVWHDHHRDKCGHRDLRTTPPKPTTRIRTIGAAGPKSLFDLLHGVAGECAYEQAVDGEADQYRKWNPALRVEGHPQRVCAGWQVEDGRGGFAPGDELVRFSPTYRVGEGEVGNVFAVPFGRARRDAPETQRGQVSTEERPGGKNQADDESLHGPPHVRASSHPLPAIADLTRRADNESGWFSPGPRQPVRFSREPANSEFRKWRTNAAPTTISAASTTAITNRSLVVRATSPPAIARAMKAIMFGSARRCSVNCAPCVRVDPRSRGRWPRTGHRLHGRLEL